jgi:hypothetical protein
MPCLGTRRPPVGPDGAPSRDWPASLVGRLWLLPGDDALAPRPQDHQAGQDALVGLDAEPLGVDQHGLQKAESPPGVFLQAGPRVGRSTLTPSHWT